MRKDQSQYLKEWYLKNRARVLADDKENYRLHKEIILARNKAWRKANREQFNAYCRLWRTKRRLANLKPYTGKLSIETIENHKKRFGGLREAVIQRDKEKCVDCKMSREEHKKSFGVDITVDHINGLGRNSEKPENTMENLQTLCLSCHGTKDHKRRSVN